MMKTQKVPPYEKTGRHDYEAWGGDNSAMVADDGIHQHYLELAKGKKIEKILRTAE